MTLPWNERNPKNIHGVPRRQWSKWNTLARHVFNKTLAYALQNPSVMTHPETEKKGGLPDDEFKTVAWNVSFMAADIAHRGSQQIYGHVDPNLKNRWGRHD